MKEQQIKTSYRNSFEILQEEEEENETQTMDYHREKEKENNTSQGTTQIKRKAQGEPSGKDDKETGEKMENVVMEIDTTRGEELSSEEEVLRKLLEEWKHLDERFVLEEQKNYIEIPSNNTKKNRAKESWEW